MAFLSDDSIPSNCNPQLATPDDSCTDVSSSIDLSHGVERVKRRSMRLEVKENMSGTRTVSGETLVETTLRPNASETSLLQAGIAALDLPWNLSGLLKSNNHTGRCEGTSDADLGKTATPYVATPTVADTTNTFPPAAQTESIAHTYRVSHDTKQTNALSSDLTRRRSSRLSILDKAGSMMETATSVLGKRSRDVMDKSKEKVKGLSRRASLRPREKAAEPGLSSFEGPVKRRKLEESGLADPNSGPRFSLSKKAVPEISLESEEPVKSTLKQEGELRHARVIEAIGRFRRDREGVLQDLDNLNIPISTYENLADAMMQKRGRNFKLPYKIFSPLPPGQPKPDEWRKTNKNVFVGEAGAIWRFDKTREYSPCMCSLETGCDEDCQNRCMFYECDDDNCNVGAELCQNRSFEGLKQRTKRGSKYDIGVEVIKTEDRGYGVRSNRTFEANQIIVEYTGEIITQDECESRMRTIYKHNECYYLMMFEQNMIIDATRGSIARFVNHSCEPNCRMEKWTVAGKPRMALFAGEKGIRVGDELTYDYNFDPFSQKNVQECRCGAYKCRGVLGPKLNKEQIRAKLVKAADAVSACSGKKQLHVLTGAKRKFQQALDESNSSLGNKKRKGIAVAKSVKASVERKLKPKANSAMKTKRKVSAASSTKIQTKTKRKYTVASKTRKAITITTKNAKVTTKTVPKRLYKKRSEVETTVSATSSSDTLVTGTGTRPEDKVEPQRRTSTALNRPTTSASARTSISLKSVTGSVKGVVRTVTGAKRGVKRTIKAL